MTDSTVHTFHIPVLGLSFSIDTPVRVARFGISSVISIVDDVLIEQMRKHQSLKHGEPYLPISSREDDSRARRITAYLNLLNRIVQKQIAELKTSAFESGSDLVKYFEMLADHSPLKAIYRRMVHATDSSEKVRLQDALRTQVTPGSIDVNIMTKLDKMNSDRNGEPLPQEYSDAVASLRGFVKSDLHSSVVFSAGLNPRLFSYLGKCEEFLPSGDGKLGKKIVLKVSDFRSAQIQGKFLAKKGIWVSEFRIESGLNCGGHAFATDGFLLGPILEEFRVRRHELLGELHQLYRSALQEKRVACPDGPLPIRMTVQGGIGTAHEDEFLRTYFGVDGTGWGSPFLLVPEATNVDDATRDLLSGAKREDFYLSDASPLGVPFNNIRGSASEKKIRERFEKGRPGSPCTKKFLVTNTEFTKQPICTASRQYQACKIKQLQSMDLPQDALKQQLEMVAEKSCLCEDLAASVFITSESNGTRKAHAVAVCPGPNLAYFSKIASLEEMVGHIYGRVQLLSVLDRPNMFVNELRLYIDYLKSEIRRLLDSANARQHDYLRTFKENLQAGIEYYHSLIPKLVGETEQYRERMREEILELEREMSEIVFPPRSVEH
jgi:hypothetical protein